ncbi:MAG: hypothetical protein JXB46_11010, partial [Candidatus Eisenbacteria bacterium]|nr:hypothetical protein [Candidatus Eisenbacteria bacterium]
GLGAIKNVGRSAIRSIEAARREHGAFEDIFDLAGRIDLRLVNRRVLESLVAAGALDGLHGHRAQQFQSVSAALELGQRAQQERDSGQMSLLDGLSAERADARRPRKLPDASPWSDGEALVREKEVLGMYVSGHPLARYEKELRTFATASISDVAEMEDGEVVRLGGIVTHVKTTSDRKGDTMAFATLEDFTGRLEIVVFSSLYAKNAEYVRRDSALILEGKVSTREDEEPKIVVSDVVPLGRAHERFVERIVISVSSVGFEESMLNTIREILVEHEGRCPVDIVVRASHGEAVTVGTGGLGVEPSRGLVESLQEVVGEHGVELVGSATGRGAGDPGF